MKNLLLTLLVLPFLSFGQVSSWRSNPPQAPSQSQSQPQRPSVQPTTPQRNDISSWRNDPPKNNFRQPSRGNTNVIVHDPYFNNFGWGWNRWNMWGAPTFGYNFWQPTWYFNDWGYRQPSRVYVYNDGKRDTIRGKKPIISFGIQKTTDKQVGGFFTIGNKGYFIAEYNASTVRDRSTFFPFGNVTHVDFPLVEDLVQRNSFYVGAGKRIKRTGVHFMIGTVSEDVKWRGKDALGYITFPKYLDRFTTMKFGALHDYKNFTLKIDYDPIVKSGTFGLGVNF